MSKHNYTQNWSGELENNLNRLFSSNDIIQRQINCLEIGSFEGHGTNIILNKLCGHQKSKIFCVDPWEDCYIPNSTDFKELNSIFKGQYERFLNNINNNSKVIIKRGISDVVLPNLNLENDELLDFAFIDGDHSPEQVYKDAFMTFKWMKIGGIILFDDYNWPYMGRRCGDGIDKFYNEYKDKLELLFINNQYAVKVINK